MFTHIVVGKFDGIYYTCSPPHCCALLVESCPTNLSLSLSLSLHFLFTLHLFFPKLYAPNSHRYEVSFFNPTLVFYVSVSPSIFSFIYLCNLLFNWNPFVNSSLFEWFLLRSRHNGLWLVLVWCCCCGSLVSSFVFNTTMIWVMAHETCISFFVQVLEIQIKCSFSNFVLGFVFCVIWMWGAFRNEEL